MLWIQMLPFYLQPKKTKVVEAPPKEKLLGKKERKRLMKITKAKEDKHLVIFFSAITVGNTI